MREKIKAVCHDEKARASMLYLIGNIFNRAIAFITIPIFSRMMSPDEYGILNTYLSWVSIFSVIVGLSMGQSLRSASVDYKNNIDGYISAIYTLSFLDFAITLLATLGIIHLFKLEYSVLLVLCCLTQSFLGFVIGVYEVRYMMEFKYVKRTFVLAVPNLLNAILSIIFIALITAEKYMGRIYGYLIVYLIFGIYFLLISYKKGKTVVKIEYWKYAMRFSLPLVIHSLSNVVLSNSDRIMITEIIDETASAKYSMVYNISLIPLVIYVSLENVWIPWFNKKMALGNRIEINKRVKQYIAVVLILTCAVMLVAPEILMLLAPNQYWDSVGLIPPIMAASFIMFLYSTSVDAEYYYKKTKMIAQSTIVAALSNLLLNYLFIPRFGIIAAAYTTLFSYSVSCVLHIWAMKKIDKELFPIGVYVLSYLIMIIFTFIAQSAIGMWYVRWGVAFFLGVLTLVFGKKFLEKEI